MPLRLFCISEGTPLQVRDDRCAGLDVHTKTVLVPTLLTQPDRSPQKQTRTCSTLTAALLALEAWRSALGSTVVARESTGVQWHPGQNLLEEGRRVILVNPQHRKAVPGGKPAVKEREWLADLRRHGLLKASFIPPQPSRERRDLTRQRTSLTQARTQAMNR